MRLIAPLTLAALALAGCSTGTVAQPVPSVAVATTSHDTVLSRAVALVVTAYPATTDDQAAVMLGQACTIMRGDPTPAGVLAARRNLVAKGAGTMVQITVLLGAAAAASCPDLLPAVRGA